MDKANARLLGELDEARAVASMARQETAAQVERSAFLRGEAISLGRLVLKSRDLATQRSRDARAYARALAGLQLALRVLHQTPALSLAALAVGFRLLVVPGLAWSDPHSRCCSLQEAEPKVDAFGEHFSLQDLGHYLDHPAPGDVAPLAEPLRVHSPMSADELKRALADLRERTHSELTLAEPGTLSASLLHLWDQLDADGSESSTDSVSTVDFASEAAEPAPSKIEPCRQLAAPQPIETSTRLGPSPQAQSHPPPLDEGEIAEAHGVSAPVVDTTVKTGSVDVPDPDAPVTPSRKRSASALPRLPKKVRTSPRASVAAQSSAPSPVPAVAPSAATRLDSAGSRVSQPSTTPDAAVDTFPWVDANQVAIVRRLREQPASCTVADLKIMSRPSTVYMRSSTGVIKHCALADIAITDLYSTVPWSTWRPRVPEPMSFDPKDPRFATLYKNATRVLDRRMRVHWERTHYLFRRPSVSPALGEEFLRRKNANSHRRKEYADGVLAEIRSLIRSRVCTVEILLDPFFLPTLDNDEILYWDPDEATKLETQLQALDEAEPWRTYYLLDPAQQCHLDPDIRAMYDRRFFPSAQL